MVFHLYSFGLKTFLPCVDMHLEWWIWDKREKFCRLLAKLLFTSYIFFITKDIIFPFFIYVVMMLLNNSLFFYCTCLKKKGSVTRVSLRQVINGFKRLPSQCYPRLSSLKFQFSSSMQQNRKVSCFPFVLDYKLQVTHNMYTVLYKNSVSR